MRNSFCQPECAGRNSVSDKDVHGGTGADGAGVREGTQAVQSNQIDGGTAARREAASGKAQTRSRGEHTTGCIHKVKVRAGNVQAVKECGSVIRVDRIVTGG